MGRGTSLYDPPPAILTHAMQQIAVKSIDRSQAGSVASCKLILLNRCRRFSVMDLRHLPGVPAARSEATNR